MNYQERKVTVSVVIPAYNRENIIGDCIKSVLAQTYKDLEVIVVDDCSADATVKVVEGIGDDRIKCYKLSKNRGACYARNYGAGKAKGKYIAFQDSDDIWLEEKLEKQVNFLESKKADLVFCGMKRINEFDNTTFYYPPYALNKKKDVTKQILFENCISTQTILLKKELMDKVEFDQTIKRFQDWDFAIRISKVARISYLPEALVTSSIQENSISKTAIRMKALKVIYEKHYKDIIKDKRIHARFLYKFAEEAFKKDKKMALDYYLESLRAKVNPKIAAKYLLVKFGIKKEALDVKGV